MRRLYKHFVANNQGVSMVEFAFIFPIFALMMMGVLEFGISSLKAQSLQRSLAAAITSVQADPQNIQNFNLANSNTSLVDFGEEGNYVCAQSYETLEQAQSGNCDAGQWVTTPPINDVTNYFVLVKGEVSRTAITPLMDSFIGNLSDRQVIAVGGNNTNGGDLTCYGEALNNRLCASPSPVSVGGEVGCPPMRITGQYSGAFFPTCTVGGWSCNYNATVNRFHNGSVEPANVEFVDRSLIGPQIPASNTGGCDAGGEGGGEGGPGR